jgi:hypothetical protein
MGPKITGIQTPSFWSNANGIQPSEYNEPNYNFFSGKILLMWVQQLIKNCE